MRRRTVVKGAAGALTTITLFSGIGSARSEGELPNGNVSESRVHPFGTRDDPIQVATGDWITHYLGWIDDEGGDHSREDVAAWLDAVEFSARIDGDPVENPDQYWGDIVPQKTDDGTDTWAVWWEYSTPPKKPGLHTFTIRLEYPDGFDDAGFEPGLTREFTSYYEVAQQ